jgi:GntR family transcriptional regulator, trigonelline degradation regulator
MAIPRSDNEPDPQYPLRVGRVAAPLRSQVLVVLRKAILDFHYKPGQRLVERELMDDLGVSRTTIREVLRELAAEGLVASLPQRGMIVVTPSLKEAKELYEVRAAMESLALTGFIARATNEQVAQLRAALNAFEREAGEGGDFRALLKSKDDAYDVVLAGAGNDSVRAIQEGLRARVRALDAASLSVPGRPLEELEELRMIVQAVERRDVEAAVQASAAHVAGASAAGLAALAAGSGKSDEASSDAGAASALGSLIGR